MERKKDHKELPNLDRFIGMKVDDINELPIVTFDGGGFLTLECSWRLRNSDCILVGCNEYGSDETHSASYKKLKDLLIGKVIKNINFIPPVSDLVVNFDENITLDLFCDSSIYENWTFSDGKEYEVISLVAGDYCCFDQQISI